MLPPRCRSQCPRPAYYIAQWLRRKVCASRVTAVAVLVLLAGAAGAGFVAADLAPAGGIVGVALGARHRGDSVARQSLGAGARQRQLVLAGRRVDLVGLHEG